ncbi:MAG: acyltransferase family protein [Bacilli bacterium]|nr:acyltransferase family protein [Bacilli bacterium]
MKKERNSNLEILRIISMIFIVISHWNVHSGLKDAINVNFVNQFIINNTVLGNIGVIIFFMITGYFQYNKNNISMN